MTTVRVGQIWEELDSRFVRKVIVIAKHQGIVKNVKIANYAGPGMPYGRSSWASEARFNGKRGGYRLISE